MPNSKTFQRYQERQKKATIKMLELLIQRIKNGSLVVLSHGMWGSRLDSKVFFKVEAMSQDSDEEIGKFGKF